MWWRFGLGLGVEIEVHSGPGAIRLGDAGRSVVVVVVPLPAGMIQTAGTPRVNGVPHSSRWGEYSKRGNCLTGEGGATRLTGNCGEFCGLGKWDSASRSGVSAEEVMAASVPGGWKM